MSEHGPPRIGERVILLVPEFRSGCLVQFRRREDTVTIVRALPEAVGPVYRAEPGDQPGQYRFVAVAQDDNGAGTGG